MSPACNFNFALNLFHLFRKVKERSFQIDRDFNFVGNYNLMSNFSQLKKV